MHSAVGDVITLLFVCPSVTLVCCIIRQWHTCSYFLFKWSSFLKSLGSWFLKRESSGITAVGF